MMRHVPRHMSLQQKEGYTFIHPFDDLAVATGQGTIAMEIFKELPLVEYILSSNRRRRTGNRCIHTCKALKSQRLKSSEWSRPEPTVCRIFKNGKVTTLPSVNTIADGTAVKTPGSNIFPYIQKNLDDDIITVEDDELIVAFLDMVEKVTR